MSQDTVTLTDHATGRELELPVIKGTHGPPAIDISALYKELGYFTYDTGFLATASCTSELTFINGVEGELLYRGYPIEQLAEQSNYLETAYLMLYGHLPEPAQYDDFESIILTHTMFNETVKNFFNGFRYDAHPMAIMVGVVGSLSAFYHDSTDVTNPRHREIAAHRLIAKMPTIAAACYKHSIGEPFMYPRNDLSYTGNLLHMLFATPCDDYEVNPVAERALDQLFILHADHEQNASTSTVRLAGSSGADPFACVSSGIASLWGPAHGGANEEVLKMLDEIGDVSNIDKYIAKAKDRNDPFRLMGFGHRVYKNRDPRATLIRKTCYEVLDSLKIDDPRFELAMRLEEIALEDEYFVKRKLYPNVDFYSGIIYSAIGIPVNMFTVMFAIARTVGWISQWTEMIGDPNHRIGRPRQIYTGAARRDYLPMDQR